MIGVVLAGGASSRFGGKPKGLIDFNGKPMALRLAATLSAVCDAILIEAPPDIGYEALGVPLIQASPAHAGKGPLAGLAAGLAATTGAVAFAPCDMPLLTSEIYRKLATQPGGAYAKTPAGLEPLVAVLHANMRQQLVKALTQQQLPRTHTILDATGARPLMFEDATPFANVNTPADLDMLSTLAH